MTLPNHLVIVLRMRSVLHRFGTAATCARFLLIPVLLAGSALSAAPTRAVNGLEALFDFQSTSGDVVKDRSQAGAPVDLKIADLQSVRRSKGALEIRRPVLIQSAKPATRISAAVRHSGEITIEAWIKPANATQGGPARIVSLSRNPVERNFTLGQEKDRYDVRFRTTKTSASGTPSLSAPAKSLKPELTHVVYTRDRAGQARIFVNGKKVIEQAVAGATSGWDNSFHLALANELTGDRPWLGTFHLVAIYSRKLSSAEVDQNFKAGLELPPAAPTPVAAAKKPAASPDVAAMTPAAKARHFDSQIAPILGRHCLECHGPQKRKGSLDLSRKEAAFAGGKSGKVIIAGNAAKSLLWQNVESGEMPEDRPPLSAEEKKLLREWIEAGAVWSANENAPLAHLPERATINSWVRRLTVPEYVATVRSAVGVDVTEEARRILPPDLRADGFNNTAYNLNIDLAHVEAYARLAQIIVGRMDVPAFAAEYGKCQHPSADCMRELITNMGRWLLRGPLEKHETDSFLAVSTAVAKQGGDFVEATRYVIEAMLQSPRFIYRIEQARENDSEQVTGYELASRLSYILWGAPPDKELMRAAEAGELSQRARVEAQVRRMLESPHAIRRSERFAYEWLDLDRLQSVRPDEKRFPRWEPEFARDMREETLAFFRHVAWEKPQPLSALLNADVTFATPRLADYYGLTPKFAPPNKKGLQALYTFKEDSGDRVRDVSGVGEPLDLKIEDVGAVRWRKDGLEVNKPNALIVTPEAPGRLIAAIKKSQAITIEAWITPGSSSQKGPARIVTLSSGTGERNFTLGQQESQFDVRFRTSKSDANGLPSLSSSTSSTATRLTHVVYTRDASGKARLFVNGEDKGALEMPGNLSNWNDEFRLALANETTGDRPWRGTFHRVAIYDRALSADEIRTVSEAWTRYDLTSVPARGGLLTQGSVLTVGGENASMVTRGLFVLRDFLWGEVGDPPPGVDTTPVPPKPGMSHRDIAELRLANSACGGCHSKFEPFAFGLERFDGFGAYHEKDALGNKLRDDGAIVFPGSDKAISYKSSAELMDLLAESERVRKGITRKLTQFALGRPLIKTDEPILDRIHAEAWKAGGTYSNLITAIVMSDLVQKSGSKSGT